MEGINLTNLFDRKFIDKTSEGKCDLSMGFITKILYSNNVFDYIEKFEEKETTIFSSKIKKDKVYFTFSDSSSIEIKKKKVKKIFYKDAIVEIVLDSPFNCLDNKNNYQKNKFVNFDDQLVRYWILKPILRLKFSDSNSAEKIIRLLTFRKDKEGSQDKKFINKHVDKNILQPNLIKKFADYSNTFIRCQNLFLNFMTKLPDIIQFYVFMLISSKILLNPIDIPEDFMNFIINESKDEKNIDRLIFTFQALTERMEIKNFDLKNKFKSIYLGNQKSIGNYFIDDRIKIKKIFVTPNLILFNSFSGEDPNRILNINKDNTDNFLRLSFTNDKMDKLGYCFDNYKSIVTSHYKNFLTNGIVIVNKNYSFLGYSNSQLRSHSVWMLFEDDNMNFDKIYKQSGDFSSEKNVSKNASRRALLFTSGKPFKTIENVEEIEDHIETLNDEKDYCKEAIEGVCVNQKYNFTDGIGEISYDLAREAAKLFNKEFASAFQVRIGGIKGILSISPKLNNQTICVRQSMKKFESQLNELYIVRTSSYSPGFLNKQIIVLLESLGITKDVFLELQENQIERLGRIKELKCSEDDLSCIKSTTFTKELITECLGNKKTKSLINDPFIKGLTMTFYLSTLESIKNKAQIYVPKSGRFIGVIDELGILEENQVFMRVCKGHGQPDPLSIKELPLTKVITGKLLVTKNPCLYPGDIQVCEAIDDERLYHYVNVIVFPNKGIRPIPQLISDGDLDGDVYFTCWDQNLIPNVSFGKFPSIAYWEHCFKINNKKPEEKSSVGKDNIIEFLCKYLQNDILGMICNRHLALSDKLSPLNQSCYKLCCYQSAAVDFGKYEETISYEELKKKEFQVARHPDYMEKAKSYDSLKTLGYAYRSIKQSYNDFIETIKTSKINYVPNNKLLYEGFEIFVNLAKSSLFDFYNEELHTNLKKYDLNTEFEFLSAIFIKFKNNKFGQDNFEITKAIKDDCKTFIDNYRFYFNLIIYHLYKFFDTESNLNLGNWKEIVNAFDTDFGLSMKLYIDKIIFQYSYDFEYDKTLKIEIANLQNDELFNNIKKSFFSACVYVSYFNYFKQEDKILKQKVCSQIEMEELIDESVYSVYDYLTQQFEDDVYMNDYYYDDFYFTDSKDKKSKNKNRKIFHSLPWIIDYSFMIENI